MGLFGKLFEKKECAICGGEIGLLGNRKLEDGNMCKHCAKKLSPWFSERRNSTINEIKQQLEYREKNQQELYSFQPSWRIGENDKLIAEERNGVPYRFVVSTANDYIEENADLIYFKDVSSCSVDIDESSREIKQKNAEGEMVSYNPPRYEYSYDFRVNLTIENNPYFSEIRFKLNNFSVDINPEKQRSLAGENVFSQFLFGTSQFDPNNDPEYSKFAKMCNEIEELVNAGRRGSPLDTTVVQDEIQASTPATEASAAPKFCMHCGAPAGGRFCTQCGAKLFE